MTAITYTATSTIKNTHGIDLPAQRPYNFAAGYLRAFLTVLVVLFHAALAYTSFAPPPPRSLLAQPRLWPAFPVVDKHHWAGFDAIVGLSDVFFMSLLFFLSGLFVSNSLQRKGAGIFLRARALRLGIPFLLSLPVLAPLAYFPSYLMTGSPVSLGAFGKQWLSLGFWPNGPAWFLSVLLAFDCLAIALFAKFPHAGNFLSHVLSSVCRTPAKLFGTVVAVSALTYVPMALAFNPLSWTTVGPFTFQTSRLLHYAAYFLIAVGLGTFGFDRTLFASDGPLAKRWLRWLGIASGAFTVQTAVVVIAVSAHTAPLLGTTLASFAFVLSCGAASFACLAFFARFGARRFCMFDSLRDNAYGIYLFHYVFVSWLQYTLLRAALPGATKGLLVFLGALALSWATAAALRRIPAIARLI
ncbi:MAG: acyltransferase [Acidobacteriaceae bacterium]|nr:acyltransferase [Acidobacteriaceae bacterium]